MGEARGRGGPPEPKLIKPVRQKEFDAVHRRATELALNAVRRDMLQHPDYKNRVPASDEELLKMVNRDHTLRRWLSDHRTMLLGHLLRKY
jgi:hypothetical protein